MVLVTMHVVGGVMLVGLPVIVLKKVSTGVVVTTNGMTVTVGVVVTCTWLLIEAEGVRVLVTVLVHVFVTVPGVLWM